MNLIPISALQREHRGKVVLLDIKQWATCKGQMGRPWHADEGPNTRGTDNPDDLRFCGFTHFVYLTELEAEECRILEAKYGPLTDSEKHYMAKKYGRASTSTAEHSK